MLEDARAEGDRRVEGRALVLLAEIALRADSDVACATDARRRGARRAAEDDLHGLYDARALLATIAWWVGDEEARAAPRRGASSSRGPPSAAISRASRSRGLAGVASVDGRTDEARELTERADRARARERKPRGARLGEGDGRPLRRLDGNYEQAEAGLREGLAMFEETGAAGRAGWAKAMLASLELRHGNTARAEDLARDAVRRLRATKEHGFLVEAERTLAEVLVAQGRVTEAERVAEHARKTVGRDDVWSSASTLHALGLVRAAQGRQDEAEELLREALGILEPTMYKQFAEDVRASLETVTASPATAAAGS